MPRTAYTHQFQAGCLLKTRSILALDTVDLVAEPAPQEACNEKRMAWSPTPEPSLGNSEP